MESVTLCVVRIKADGTAPAARPSSVTDTLDRDQIAQWRKDWDAVMAMFMPGLAGFEATLFAAAEAVGGSAPGRVLDLGGGPGILAERMLRRWPAAAVTLVDLDPVLLTVARAGTPDEVTVVEADLATSAWPGAVDRRGSFDVVIAVMTVHYLHARQVAALYRNARPMLAPGGILVVADVMPDGGIPSVMNAMGPVADEAAAELAWAQWWHEVAAVPAFEAMLRQREELFGSRPKAEPTPEMAWHLDAARAAGFAEVGVLWRCGGYAAFVAVA